MFKNKSSTPKNKTFFSLKCFKINLTIDEFYFQKKMQEISTTLDFFLFS